MAQLKETTINGNLTVKPNAQINMSKVLIGSSITEGTGYTHSDGNILIGDNLQQLNAPSGDTGMTALSSGCIVIGCNGKATSSAIAIGGATEIDSSGQKYDYLVNASGKYSIAIGDGCNSGGLCSIAIGFNTAATASSDVAIGSGAKCIEPTTSGIAIGNNAECKQSYGVAIGSSSAKATSEYPIVIGSINSRLAKIGRSATSWVVNSDVRDKAEFEDMDTAKALELINTIIPTTYVMNDRGRYYDPETKKFDYASYIKQTKKNHRRTAGFKAQQVYDSLKQVYNTDNYANIVDYSRYDDPNNMDSVFSNEHPELNDQYSIRYDLFIPFLTGAVQELSSKVNSLEENLSTKQNEIDGLKALIEAQQAQINELKTVVSNLTV